MAVRSKFKRKRKISFMYINNVRERDEKGAIFALNP